MRLFVLDPSVRSRLLIQREGSDSDRMDEVWQGVHVMSPPANNEHQKIATSLSGIFWLTIETPGLGEVYTNINLSDRVEDWEKNYREPDVVVFLDDTSAVNHDTHWVGSPDFVVEVVSRYDQSRKKLDFYSSIGTRELLMVERFPWSLELYRFTDGKLALVGTSTLKSPEILPSEVLPLSFQLAAGKARPMIKVDHNDGARTWTA